jgi:hypothetical protein
VKERQKRRDSRTIEKPGERERKQENDVEIENCG